jgi:hypothetical protein
MSSSDNSVASVLITSAVKVVGKREFLKTVETMFDLVPARKVEVKGKGKVEKKQRKPRTLKPVPEENRCCARVKGDISAVVGKRHYFSSARCTRGCVASSDLCAIHRNQSEKFGALPDGRIGETLTNDQATRYNDATA